jgi:hypothetical protein
MDAQQRIDARTVRGSRSVWKVPDSISEILYTLHDLLDWMRYEQSVGPTALPLGSFAHEAMSPLHGRAVPRQAARGRRGAVSLDAGTPAADHPRVQIVLPTALGWPALGRPQSADDLNANSAVCRRGMASSLPEIRLQLE